MMASRAADWFAQAEHDIEVARGLRANGHYEWAAFACQQAAEKALKAVLQQRGKTAWGHSVVELLQAVETPDEAGDLRGCAIRLDRSYMGARYPDTWPEGPPHQYYQQEDADEALDCAERIVRFCHGLLA